MPYSPLANGHVAPERRGDADHGQRIQQSSKSGVSRLKRKAGEDVDDGEGYVYVELGLETEAALQQLRTGGYEEHSGDELHYVQPTSTWSLRKYEHSQGPRGIWNLIADKNQRHYYHQSHLDSNPI